MSDDPTKNVGRKVLAFPYDQNGKGASVVVLPIVENDEIVGYLPASATDNGDGTATLQVDAELSVSEVTIGDVKVGSTDGGGVNTKFLHVNADGDLYVVDALVDGETPAGTIDGINDEFTTFYEFKPGTTHIYQNGLRLKEGVGFDYVEEVDHQTLTFVVPPEIGDVLLVDYRKI